jgi:hypothetical protein
VKSALISYSHADLTEARSLARIIREAGVRPWRDQDSLVPGRKTEDEIRRAIRDETLGAVIWLTKDAVNSKYVTEVELPAIVERHRAGGYAVLPAFRGLGPEEAAELVRSRTGLEIGGFHGVVIGDGADATNEMHRVAAAFVQARLQAHEGERAIVRAVTRDDTAPNLEDATLDFDWRHAYDDESIPNPVELLALKAGLRGSASALLAKVGGGPVLVALKTHLSVATAIGHALRRTTGAVPIVAHYGQEWSASVGGDSGVPVLDWHLDTGPQAGEVLAVEVSISQNVAPGVDRLVAESGVPFRGRLKFSPVGGPSQKVVEDAVTANAWAEQIVDRMIASRDELRATGIALFFAAPLPIAVFVGWRANAAGSMTVYEWLGNQGPYVPGWTLPQ